jgi:carboxymethylenebutenolidase
MAKTLLRILLALLGLAVLAVLVVGGIILFDTLAPAQRASDFANVSFTSPDGVPLQGYLARPAADGPHPALLLIHAFYGLDADIVAKADRLAEQGYVVLAADAYRDRSTRLLPRAIFLVITTSQDQITADMLSAWGYLRALPEVDPTRIGAVGFCFGGTQVLEMGVFNPDVAASVIFYGSSPITDPNALGSFGMGGPVLAIYGEEDAGIPLEEVRGFEAAMQARGIPHTVTVYPGVGHAFVHADNIDQPGPAADAWQQMLAFLQAELKPTAPAALAAPRPAAAPLSSGGLHLHLP